MQDLTGRQHDGMGIEVFEKSGVKTAIVLVRKRELAHELLCATIVVGWPEDDPRLGSTKDFSALPRRKLGPPRRCRDDFGLLITKQE